MATKANRKSYKTSETELFSQVVSGFRGDFRILTKMELFLKIVYN